MAFENGSVVQLRSGGPLMTVVETKGDEITCIWFGEEQDEVCRSGFPAFALVPVDIEDEDEEEDDEE